MSGESGVMRGTVLRTERWAKRGDALTERQTAILLAAADGLTYKGIGGQLGISERTVKAHANVIFVKLDAASMTQAVAIFLRTPRPATEDRGRLRALACMVLGHVGPEGFDCPRCGRRIPWDRS